MQPDLFGRKPVDHIAILESSGNITDLIRSGKKTVESRWLVRRSVPYGKVITGDTVYFKTAGRPVTFKAQVMGVEEYDSIRTVVDGEDLITRILRRHGTNLCMSIEEDYSQLANKNFCCLIFLDKPQDVRPFLVDKTGYGCSTAWLTVPSVQSIVSRYV